MEFILLPLLAAVLVQPLKGKAPAMAALAASLLSLVWTLVRLFQFSPDGSIQLAHHYEWIAAIGFSFSIGADGISMLMLLLTNCIVPLIVLSSFSSSYERPQRFYGLLLLMQAALVGVFLAQDGLLFYLFWELALIPIYLICGIYGGEGRIRITFKFFVYTFLGSLAMLAALIFLYLQTPGYHDFSWSSLQAVALDPESAGWVLWAFFIAFAIKMPVFPFHTWQPDTYTNAPTAGTMLLSGIMLKMGIYGVVRWMLPLAPEGLATNQPIFIALAVIGVVYAAIIAIRQQDLKRIIAYSSISHVGLIAAGVLTFNLQGLQGGMIQMLSHGLNVVGLFLVIDILERRYRTRELHALGGIALQARPFAVLFMIILLGSVAVPLTNGFAGEFLLLNGLFHYQVLWAAVAGLTIIFCAVYMLRVYQFTMFGSPNTLTSSFAPLALHESLTLGIIAALVIGFGFFPQLVLQLTEASVQQLLQSTVK